MDQGIKFVTPEMEKLATDAAARGAEALATKGEFLPFVTLIPADDGDAEIVEIDETNPDKLVEAIREIVRDQRYRARLYAVCYDGYVRANGTEVDAVVVEFANNTEVEAHAIGLPYDGEGDTFQIEEQATYLGECPTYFFVAENEM